MTDALPHTARSFAAFYGISRDRLARIVAISLRDHAGAFGLTGLGFFKAVMVDAHRMAISQYTPPRIEAESIPVFPLKGSLAPAAQTPAPPPPGQPSAPASDSDAPTKYDLELRVLAERATSLRQKNVLEQARLRDETVSYCSTVIQLILAALRSDIDSIHLDPAAASRLRAAIDAALADLDFVLPSIIEGVPRDRIELDLLSRRADRLAASSRQPASPPAHPDQSPDPDRT